MFAEANGRTLNIMYFHLIITIILIWISFLDFKKLSVDNIYFWAILLIGIGYRLSIDNFLIGLYCFIFFFVLSSVLWMVNGFGGADAKLLMVLSWMLPYSHFPNMFATILIFILVLLVCAGLYSVGIVFIAKKGKRDEVPFIPIISLAYFIVLYTLS